MSTQEERLTIMEYNLKQFKTETIKAYGDMAYEMVIIKGLGEDSIKRLATVSRQIENMDGRLSTIEHDLKSMKAQVDQRFDAIETMLTQILTRLPKNP
jgi:hypothetical protein